MAIFAILSKDTEELIFDQLCYNGETYGKLLFRSYLPSWAKLRIKWYLSKFATLSKTVANEHFDHVCHTEQRYGRSDNLTSFTTLGETQKRWIFAQIYYPGQNCWKMSFGHFYHIEQKCGKLLLWPNLLKRAKAFKNSFSIAFAHLSKNLTNVSFAIKFDTPINALIK